MSENNELISIQQMIHEIRGQKVMLDSDLAMLYEVEVKRLNEAVKRNIERFPEDFMFQLTHDEFSNLKSHFATSSWGGKRKLPYAFTEQGVATLSGLLNSKIAISINIQIIRTFVKLRQLALSNIDLFGQIKEIREMLLLHIENNENRFSEHSNAINNILEALYNLSSPIAEPKKIGFDTEPKEEKKRK